MSRKFRSWDSVLAALSEYMTADELALLGLSRPLKGLEVKGKVITLQDASVSPSEALLSLHGRYKNDFNDWYRDGGCKEIGDRLPKSWDVSPEEWKLMQV